MEKFIINEAETYISPKGGWEPTPAAFGLIARRACAFGFGLFFSTTFFGERGLTGVAWIAGTVIATWGVGEAVAIPIDLLTSSKLWSIEISFISFGFEEQ